MLRAPALEALGRVAGRDALARIAPHLLDPDPALRNAAIRAVVEIEQRATASGESLDPEVQAALKHEDLVAHLIGMLADEDSQNRRTAAVTLGWLREARAVAPLLELLGDAAVREFASHALVSIGFRERAACEGGLAHADDAVRLGAVRCLAWIAPLEGTALVAPLIHDPAAEVRAEAAAAIGRLGDEDAPMLLFELLGDESELIQESAMDALSRMSPGARPPPPRAGPRRGGPRRAGPRGADARAPARPGRGVRPGGRVAGRREALRAAAMQALGEIGGADVAEVLRSGLADEQLDRAPAGRPRPGPPARARLGAAAPAPPRRGGPARALRGRARPRSDPEPGGGRAPAAAPRGRRARSCASRRSRPSGRCARPGRCAPWWRCCATPTATSARAAAEALGEIGDPQAAAALLVALEDEHWSVRCAAAAALGRIGSGKAVSALVARVDDYDATVRRAAVAALGEIRDPRGAFRLVAGPRRPRPPGRRARGPAPARHGRPAARWSGPSPRRTLDADQRRLLVDLAGRFEDASARRLLLVGLDDASPAVRAEAAAALGDGGFREALRPLLEKKAQDPSPEVRQAAASALRKLQPR